MRGDEFIDRLEILFKELGVATKRYKKPTNTRVAPTETIHDITLNCHAVVIALSDCSLVHFGHVHHSLFFSTPMAPQFWGVNVITEEFADAFEVQRKAIGFRCRGS